MSMKSMTGYGRPEGEHEDWSWVWEVRAVNGKSLDMRLRLPPGFENLDVKIRKQVAGALGRGNLQITLAIHSSKSDGEYSINHNFLQHLLKAEAKYSKQFKVKPSRFAGLLKVQGVLDANAMSAVGTAVLVRNKAVLRSLDDMLASLIRARVAEGKELYKVLLSCVSSFESLIQEAGACAAKQPAQIKEKLTARIMELLGDNLAEDKLIQEVSILAAKADVREEIDRLDAHIKQAKTLLDHEGAIGRKLDFLSQEFIREINTICSKSTSIELTRIGLAMKSLIEQFREQAANVE